MPETVTCNLCGADGARRLYSMPDHRFWVDDEEWSVVECSGCGLGYLNPRPTRSEIRRYYPAAYYGLRAQLAAQYQRQASYMPEQSGRLLEIGAARGDFLELMRQRGWDVAGIEPSTDAENPYELPIHRGSFPDTSPFDSDTFDVITAWAVFEHLHDPAGAFAECARLLRPGGLLLLQVPNFRSLQSHWAAREDVPRHLYFYDASTLARYGALSGLRLESVIHTTDFGGGGRGLLCVAFARAIGRSTVDVFRLYSVPRGERFRRWPVFASTCTAVSLLERIVLSDRLIAGSRLSGQLVAYFGKPSLNGRVELARA